MLNIRAEGPKEIWLKPTRWKKSRDTSSNRVETKRETKVKDWQNTLAQRNEG